MQYEFKMNRRFFKPTADGRKTFEIRRNDRDFKAGDIIIFREWDDIMSNYTGRNCKREVTYIYNGMGQFGLDRNYVILGLKEVK